MWEAYFLCHSAYVVSSKQFVRFGASAFSESKALHLNFTCKCFVFKSHRPVHIAMFTTQSPRLFLAIPLISVVGITMCIRMKLFQGRRPRTLGVKDGKFLAKIKSSPNNVSSQANKEVDPSHYVEPFQFTSESPTDAIQTIKSTVENMERTHVVECTDDYLYAKFSTKLFGFVDDVEFYADKCGKIDVRSASRLGHSDFGVNRKRVEAIRQMWQLSAVNSKM